MISEKPVRSYACQAGVNHASGYFAMGFLFLIGIACFFSVTVVGTAIGLCLVTLPVYIVRRTPQYVDFFHGFAVIHYVGSGRAVTVRYEDIKIIRPVTVLSTRERIFVAEMKSRKPVKNFSWSCTDREFDEMKHLLKGNKIRISREVATMQ